MRKLHKDIEIYLSTVNDGSMRTGATPELLVNNTAAGVYLAGHGIAPENAVLLRLAYDTDDFCTYREVTQDEVGAGFTKPQMHRADAFMTRRQNVALFLPIADCIGAVLYHPPTHTLMLSHLGRHNLEQDGGTQSVKYLVQQGVNPHEILVYLSPAAGKEFYPLFAFANRSLHDVAVEQLQKGGVLAGNITIDARDTVTDPDFFSHSAALRGEKPHGRHAIVCRIR